MAALGIPGNAHVFDIGGRAARANGACGRAEAQRLGGAPVEWKPPRAACQWAASTSTPSAQRIGRSLTGGSSGKGRSTPRCCERCRARPWSPQRWIATFITTQYRHRGCPLNLAGRGFARPRFVDYSANERGFRPAFRFFAKCGVYRASERADNPLNGCPTCRVRKPNSGGSFRICR
jgi:hypothetical protein